MKFLQKLLSRSLLIIVIVVAGLVYINRDQLFPKSETETVGETQTESKTVTGSDAVEKTSDMPTIPGWGTEQDSDVDLQPKTELNASMDSAEATPDAATQPKADVPVKERSAETTAAEVAAIPADTTAADFVDRARQAFWTGDIDAAKEAYARAMELDTQDPDIAGELGNLLYGQGDMPGAVAAYLEAGDRLIAADRYQNATQILEILRTLDPDSATTFEERLLNKS